MTAIEIREPGGPEVLRPVERPVPGIGPREVLVRVVAAGVNRPDLLQRAGFVDFILLRTILLVMLGTWALATLGGEWYYRR